MQPSVSMIIAAVFLVMAFSNVVLMLETSRPSRSATTKLRLMTAHRALWYVFVGLFCLMAYTMSRRLASVGMGRLPTFVVARLFALSVVPLLLLSIAIARGYKQSQSALRALGTAIFIASFVFASLPSLSELLRSTSRESLVFDLATGFLAPLCLAQVALVLRSFRRPAHPAIQAAPIPASPTPGIAVTSKQGPTPPMTLLLAHVEQQTHDTRTLRFMVPKELPFRFKPGQFLTFQWTVDGRRIPRSYTICSSPAKSNYVEITPKRLQNGCVSVFLNDQAKPGLAVEACGPYGKFYFDEAVHRRIVLLAAGSGITPMISILRYIDDLKLRTSVTLLYFVRTGDDIIFANELQRLATSIPRFRYSVCLSRPDNHWTGDSGHLSEQLMLRHVSGSLKHMFFICGPKGFMDTARQILLSLGVSQERVAQESFGETRSSDEAGFPQATATIMFSQSQEICQAEPGCSLEVPEKNGIRVSY
jgi:ferredoxin-NADP reductase